MIQKKHFSLINTIVIIIGTSLIFTMILKSRLPCCGEDARKTKAAAQVRQIALAVENYYSDYQEFPEPENLYKKNAREKTYYSSSFETHDGEEIHIKVDQDLDGFITFKDEKIKAKAIAWTTYKGETIRSWDK